MKAYFGHDQGGVQVVAANAPGIESGSNVAMDIGKSLALISDNPLLRSTDPASLAGSMSFRAAESGSTIPNNSSLTTPERGR